MIGPDAPYEAKARHLRRLYRQTGGERSVEVHPEFERLFPDGGIRLGQILVDVWKEARRLAGWTYDNTAQGWRRADGSPVLDDDGSEWRHL